MACRRTFANRGEVKNIYRHSNAPDRDEAQSRGNPGVTPHVLAASPDHDDDGGDYGGQGVTTVVSVSDQLVQRQKGGRKPRKSCSFCAKRKKKCSGNGIDKCRYYSLCIERRRAECVYELRASSKPKKPLGCTSTTPASPVAAATAAVATAGLLNRAKRARPTASGPSECTTPAAGVIAHAQVSSVKRCPLNPSPATGLLGMQENVFLWDYFDCLGLLPFVTKSEVRQAMTGIMAESSKQADCLEGPQRLLWPLAGGGDLGEAGQRRGSGGAGGWNPTESSATEGVRTGTDSTTCLFWCAIALGALVRGPPMEKVKRYVQMARRALAGCFDECTLGTARAHMMMAFVHNFLGEKVKHGKYMGFAKNILEELQLSQEIPPEMVRLLMMEEKTRVLFSKEATVDDVWRYCEEGQSLPEPSDAEQAECLASFIMHADIRGCGRFLEDMLRHGDFLSEADRCQQLSVDWGSRRSTLLFTLPKGNEPKHHGLSKATHTVVNSLSPKMESVTRKAEKAGVCNGFGGMMCYSNLASLRAVRNNMVGSLAGIWRCADILLAYPGLVRYSAWLHAAHCVFTTLADTQNRQMFERVRKVYNALKPEGHLPVPPFEEWTDVSQVCDFIVCRSMKVNQKQFRSAHESSDKGASSHVVGVPDSEYAVPLSPKQCIPGDTTHPSTTSTGVASTMRSSSPSNASFRAKSPHKEQQEGFNKAMDNLQESSSESACQLDAIDGSSRKQTPLSFGDMVDSTSTAAAVTAAAVTPAFGQVVWNDGSVAKVRDGAAPGRCCVAGCLYGFSCAATECVESRGGSGVCGAGCDGVAPQQAQPCYPVGSDDEQEALFGIGPGVQHFWMSAFDPALAVPERKDDHGTETSAEEPTAKCNRAAKRALVWAQRDAATNTQKMSLAEQLWRGSYASCEEEEFSSPLPVTVGCSGNSNGLRDAGAASISSASTVSGSPVRRTPEGRVSLVSPNVSAHAAGDDITPPHENSSRGGVEARDGSVSPLGAIEISLEAEDMYVEDDLFSKVFLEEAFGFPE